MSYAPVRWFIDDGECCTSNGSVLRGKHRFHVVEHERPARHVDKLRYVAACTSREAAESALRLINGKCQPHGSDN